MSLGQFNSCPMHAHLLAARSVLRYLLDTIDFALLYNFNDPKDYPLICLLVPHSCGFVNADWASDSSTWCSVSGYAFFIFSSLLSWSSICQHIVALSSTEAKYISMVHAMHKAIWICLLLILLSMLVPQPFPLICYNRSAINIAKSDSTNSHSKHIDIHYHFIYEHFLSGSFKLTWVLTSDMVMDILIKALPHVLHDCFVVSLGLVRQ